MNKLFLLICSLFFIFIQADAQRGLDDQNNIIKVNLASTISLHPTMHYERYIHNNFSINIGAGLHINTVNPTGLFDGFYFKSGNSVYLQPRYYFNKNDFKLKGHYIGLLARIRNFKAQGYTTTEQVRHWDLVPQYGYQTAIKKRFIIDANVGIGNRFIYKSYENSTRIFFFITMVSIGYTFN